MAKMTTSEALKYVVKANGQPFTVDLRDRVIKFLSLLPHHPSDTEYYSDGVKRTVRDYDYGWYTDVLVIESNGKLSVEIVDGDNLDPNPNRVKSNAEALALLEEYRNIKWASDVDEYWNMSDDHKYWCRMNDINLRAFAKQDEIKNKLA